SVVVAPEVRVPLQLSTVDGVDAARELLSGLAATPFDLASGPLVRAALARLSDVDHVLLVVVHHIVFDGWSIDVFLTDLFRAYRAPLGPPPARYGDYAAWQRGRYSGERDLAFWRDH